MTLGDSVYLVVIATGVDEISCGEGPHQRLTFQGLGQGGPWGRPGGVKPSGEQF